MYTNNVNGVIVGRHDTIEDAKQSFENLRTFFAALKKSNAVNLDEKIVELRDFEGGFVVDKFSLSDL